MSKEKKNTVNSEKIIIGSQTWMKNNLDVSTFNNGDQIVEVKTMEELLNANKQKIAAWCYYDFNNSNGNIFGKLYNYYTIIDKRSVAPDGFRIPAMKDWNNLIEYAGGDEIAGLKLRGTEHWKKDTVFNE
jgi:uncharacterized protein (TIGR02145 family)